MRPRATPAPRKPVSNRDAVGSVRPCEHRSMAGPPWIRVGPASPAPSAGFRGAPRGGRGRERLGEARPAVDTAPATHASRPWLDVPYFSRETGLRTISGPFLEPPRPRVERAPRSGSSRRTLRRWLPGFDIRSATVAGLLGLICTPLAAHAGSCFAFSNVVKEARTLAATPYQPPPQVPAWLRNLSYNAYQSIRFKPSRSLWQKHGSRFQVELVPPGLYYTAPVRIRVVTHCTTHPVPFLRSDFTYPSRSLEKRMPKLGYAGLKLTYPLVGRDCCNQFLVFAGASYFRVVGRPNNFGLSARGIAIDTAFPPHEEFPAFRAFWLERPRRNARHIVVDALLDGPSVAGAYRFVIRPGQETVVDMRVRLFFRRRPRLLGIAPLTSMFFYGAGTPRPPGEWRPAVHDSDGLELANGDGEWIWRPLIDPPRFLVTSFELDNPRGFGLVQTAQRFSDYEDLSARYDTRPSAWIVPQGSWGHGRVELVEIPTTSETMDNIVAYWVPGRPVVPGREYRYNYRVLFGRAQVARPPDGGYVTRTFVGAGRNPGMPCDADRHTLRFIVDFALPQADLNIPAQGVVSAVPPARVHNVAVIDARNIGFLHRSFDRLSFQVTVPKGHPVELRAFLRHDAHVLTETWSDMLPRAQAERLAHTPGCPS